MATGVEIWLGGTLDWLSRVAPRPLAGAAKAVAKIGTEDVRERRYEAAVDLLSDLLRKDANVLNEAWLAALTLAGFKPAATTTPGVATTRQVELSLGARLAAKYDEGPFAPFEFFDTVTNERYDGVEQARRPVGVALSGRYRPVFLDWRAGPDRGGIDEPMRLDDLALRRMIGTARDQIVHRLPWMATAEPLLVVLHY